MKKIVLLVMGLISLAGMGSAYQINIDAPDTLPIGKPLIVTGTTNFGIGTPIDVVLYYQLTTSTEIKRKIAYVQSDKSFRVVFDTTNLQKGTYKIEVPASGLGDSVNMKLVHLVDRSDEITLTSGLQQEFNGFLAINGRMESTQNSGIQIEITGPDGDRIFGPQYIATDYQGTFTSVVPIQKAGVYDVSFTDSRGYIGTRSITVFSGLATATMGISVTATVRVVSSHATASRDSPAFFDIKTGSGIVTVYTSPNNDWVIEYFDERGILHTVNNHGERKSEEITINGKGKTTSVKVYPYKYAVSDTVTVYAEQAQSIRASQGVPELFSEATAGETTPPAQAPILPAMTISAMLLVALLLRSRT